MCRAIARCLIFRRGGGLELHGRPGSRGGDDVRRDDE